jgi:uncharacterized lipoprotein YddW (UPF0748 family)
LTEATPTPPSAPHPIVAKVASVAANGVTAAVHGAAAAVKAVVPHVLAGLSLASTLTGLTLAWNTMVLLARNWTAWLILGPLMIAIYAWGHHEEAAKYTAIFGKLQACMTRVVPVCSAPAPAAAVAPLLSAPVEAPAPVVAPAPAHKHRKAPAAQKSWWQL